MISTFHCVIIAEIVLFIFLYKFNSEPQNFNWGAVAAGAFIIVLLSYKGREIMIKRGIAHPGYKTYGYYYKNPPSSRNNLYYNI